MKVRQEHALHLRAADRKGVRIGPVIVSRERDFNVGADDYCERYTIACKHVGGFSILPPAWLLNAAIRMGLLEQQKLDQESADRLWSGDVYGGLYGDKDRWLDMDIRKKQSG